MAKKLIPTGYTISVDENTITLPGNILPERLLLITCINNNKIIYNFADPAAGITAYQFSEDTESTQFTMLLDLDAADVGVEDDSLLQVFVETDYAGIGFQEAMLDPVNKLRVSNPENLIDTDFEYGLQSSKWETLQTVLNIPTIYSTSGDVPIEDLTGLEVTNGSKQVKIVLGSDAELRLGDPIVVQGTTLKNAEGYFLISGVVDARTYFYEMDVVAAATADISGSYTTVVPAKFFEGSNLPLALDTDNGIITDTQNPSTITVTTTETHGLQINTKVYLRNTVGPKTLEIVDPTLTAPDGRPYVDSTATLTFTNTVDATLSVGGGGALEFPVVTWDWEGTYNKYLASTDLNVTTDEITWAGHGFEDNAALLFQAQVRGQTNAGMEDGKVYYVSVVDADTIQLATDYGTLSNIVNITALDISRGHPRLTLVYKVEANEGNDRFTAFYTRNVTSNQTTSITRSNIQNNNANTFTWNLQPTLGTGRVPIEGIIYQFTYSGNLNASSEYIDNTFTGRNYLGLGSSNVTYRLNPSNTSGSINVNLDVTRCFYLSGSNYSITVTHDAANVISFNKFGQATNSYSITFRIRMRSIPATMDAAHSGSDFLNGVGGAGGLGARVYAFQGVDASSSYSNSNDAYSNLASQRENGRYATGILRQNYNASTTSNLGAFTINYNDSGREEFGTGSEIFYGFANDLTSFRNTIYIPDHGFEDGQAGTVTVSNYSTTNRFEFVDSNANSVAIVDSVFPVTISKVSDNYIRLSINQSPNTDDISSFPEEFTIEAEKNNELYNTIYVSNHKIVGSVIARYSTSGTVIGGLTSGTDYSLAYVNDSRLIIKDSAVSAGSNSVTTGAIGSTSNNQNQTFSIDVETPLGLDPANVTITSVEFRGDFSGRNEWVVLEFDDGSTYDIGRNGGQDTDQWITDQNFAPKNISAILTNPGGVRSFNAIVSPTSAVNFTHAGMTNWWELRFNVLGVAGDIVLTGTGSGLQTFNVSASEGAYDGVYKIKTLPDSKSFTLETDFEIPRRVYEFDAANDVDQGQDFITLGVQSPYTPHNMYPGEELVYDVNGGSADIYDTANVTEIYAVPINQFQILLSNSYTSALAGTRIQLTPRPSTETHLLTTNSLVKLTEADGTVSGAINTQRITGAGTRFLSDFKRGDVIWMTIDGRIQNFTIDYITTDTELFILDALPAAATSAAFFFQTQANLRPDGYSLHKSFDGGVDITAGTSPNSKIVRQTRKYFRYQSGKGIQNSFAINFSPAKVVASLTFSATTGTNIVTCVCQEPHNLVVGDEIEMTGAVVTVGDNLYNGNHIVTAVPDINTYEYEVTATMIQGKAAGFPEYSRASWRDSFVRVGMFDEQNGFFYEYDGDKIYCVRRSSTLQLSGTVNSEFNSQVITGTLTSFTTQIAAGESIVVRGQSYRVVEVSSDSRMVVQPAYRGVTSRNIKITKTVDVRVPQEDWSIDPADGTGANGFNLDIHKLQMGYADYSWYGAGKIRFGFKDRDGHVVYMHEFKHNNRLNESYFRSGNLPGRYEIENGNNPSSAPTLFHFGTSVIMDGTFDDDKAYLFSAQSKPFVFAQGLTGSFNSTADTTFEEITLNGERVYVYAATCTESDASSVAVGQLIADSTNHLPDKTYVTQVVLAGANSKVYTSYPATRLNPTTLNAIASGTTFSYGETVFGGDVVDLTRPIPLISIRLAPSVDSGLTGKIGEREIVNRMQMALKTAGVTTNKDVEIFFILNGLPSKLTYDKVNTPSLSELISHDTGDFIQRGTTVFTTKASAGSVEIPSISELIDMGNSIMGGDSVFPAGPDLMTLAVQPQDTSTISQTDPMIVSGKISWSESQA